MAQDAGSIQVYLEIGRKRTFAAALNWPGWCRSGRDDASALQALLDYGPRYARAMLAGNLAVEVPASVSSLIVVDRVAGSATTDFGAPDRTLPGDARPVEPAELQRWQGILTACWRTFDSAVHAAEGKTLRLGPRGGGRDLTKIVRHVRDANIGYLASLGVRLELSGDPPMDQTLTPIRQVVLTGLAAAVRGKLPERGPRGGLHWTPRFFVRRLAWHELDHAWEIEDRIEKT